MVYQCILYVQCQKPTCRKYDLYPFFWVLFLILLNESLLQTQYSVMKLWRLSLSVMRTEYARRPWCLFCHLCQSSVGYKALQGFLILGEHPNNLVWWNEMEIDSCCENFLMGSVLFRDSWTTLQFITSCCSSVTFGASWELLHWDLFGVAVF